MPAHGKRRALGQHFLKDTSVIDRIVDRGLELASEHEVKSLLEIGPGRGALTLPLLERLGRAPSIARFTLCERDRDLAANWRAFDVGNRLLVREGDFVTLPREEWFGEAPIGIVSNLPYSAGTAILDRLAREHESIPFMVLMFQAEVAQRLRAEPGTKAWGSLSIWLQNRWDVSRLIAVPPGAFSPPPEVNSEVVVLLRREKPRVEVTDEKLWEDLLKACFAQRRKMLRSALSSRKPYRSALDASGVDVTKRAEALDWSEWNRLLSAAARAL
ncbi:MAG TPA: 16S rRNA (adenine(1518)-N(6)/adenine(1519)-N(6))-dimethyltransferase RsmA [Bdellovibrionota bacterium]|nr:16S rRNA (adenine(1518)-N(6)/adenine(1519)-N(6))-dimethyltransferase RsmA [Bdellovibrionota bacterium]